MLEFSEKVLVLHVGRFREADAWIRFLSPSRGVLTAFAFGGCKSRKRFCGCLDPFNEVLFKVKSNRRGTYLNLEEGVLCHAFQQLRKDPQRLGPAVNCIKFAEAAADRAHAEAHAATYALLTATLRVLDAAPDPSPLVPVLFRARLAFDQGLQPDLSRCTQCGAPLGVDAGGYGGGRMLVEQGRMLCPACRPNGLGLHLPLCGAALDLLALVRHSTPETWQALHPPPQVRRECAAAVEAFVRFHLGLAWERGMFRRI